MLSNFDLSNYLNYINNQPSIVIFLLVLTILISFEFSVYVKSLRIIGTGLFVSFLTYLGLFIAFFGYSQSYLYLFIYSVALYMIFIFLTFFISVLIFLMYFIDILLIEKIYFGMNYLNIETIIIALAISIILTLLIRFFARSLQERLNQIDKMISEIKKREDEKHGNRSKI